MLFFKKFKGYSYSIDSFQKDLTAGLIVGVIAIPLGMAFAIASGVKPEYGIYTTIIAGFFISIFGVRNIKLVVQRELLYLSYLRS